LGIEGFPLGIGPDRAPLWPSSVVGSITHCDRFCAAAVARRAAIGSIGIDAETSRSLPRELLPLVCSPLEIRRLRGLPSCTDWPTLLFSAKESFYKCYYPLAGERLDFLDVDVEIVWNIGRFDVMLSRASARAVCGQRRFQGRFAHTTRHVLTAVILEVA
jgi:4'-phosphopantetheinyl transferase EntD